MVRRPEPAPGSGSPGRDLTQGEYRPLPAERRLERGNDAAATHVRSRHGRGQRLGSSKRRKRAGSDFPGCPRLLIKSFYREAAKHEKKIINLAPFASLRQKG